MRWIYGPKRYRLSSLFTTRNRSKGLVKRLDFSKFILPKANVLDYTDILINIRKIIRSINLESKRIDKQYGISIPQYLCLNFLNTREVFRATAKEIGIHLNLNASTVSGLIVRLEKKGYVAKVPHSEDKRSSYIYLTAIGAQVVNSIPDLLHEKLTTKLKQLPDKDLNSLQSSLALLIGFMEVEGLDASPVIAPDEHIISN